MRTTIEFDSDVSRAIEQIRRDEGLGVSAAVNELIRRGLVALSPKRKFKQKTHALGITMDVSNTAEAIETLEGPNAR